MTWKHCKTRCFFALQWPRCFGELDRPMFFVALHIDVEPSFLMVHTCRLEISAALPWQALAWAHEHCATRAQWDEPRTHCVLGEIWKVRETLHLCVVFSWSSRSEASTPRWMPWHVLRKVLKKRSRWRCFMKHFMKIHNNHNNKPMLLSSIRVRYGGVVVGWVRWFVGSEKLSDYQLTTKQYNLKIDTLITYWLSIYYNICKIEGFMSYVAHEILNISKYRISLLSHHLNMEVYSTSRRVIPFTVIGTCFITFLSFRRRSTTMLLPRPAKK